MEEMSFEVPQSTCCDDTLRQEKETSVVMPLCRRSGKRDSYTLPNTTPGEGEDPFEKGVQALTNYFIPRQNREYEIYIFHQAKQDTNESISAFHTRLRQLAVACEFAEVDREIKTQIE